MPHSAVTIDGVTHRYGGHVALRDVSIDIPRGARFGLLGPNGSGKTTLFRILAALMPPSEGRVAVFGTDPAVQPAAVRKRLGVVFQDVALDENLTVRESLRFQGALYNLQGSTLSDRIARLLRRFELAERADTPVKTLSGGLQRRADLARGLLHRPQLLLLDEPTTGLDPGARRTLWEVLDRLQDEEDTTLLVATHLMDEAERCDTVAILDDGTLVAEGTPDALKADLGHDTLWIEADDPARLRDRIEAQFGATARVIGSTVQVQADNPPALLSSLYDAMGDRIATATIRKPTLEDVFMAHAGRPARTAEPSLAE
jgi:ABC-2 type transport system ATP-binding protein